jgi:iron(II)-dependent oxidoreductase
MRLSPTADALAEARERTLALVAPLSDADVEAQHTQIMSPLVWDLAHIAAYEELWLVHRFAGLPLARPELAAMYDAFETPRAVRGDLPLLDRAQALEYLESVRERVPPEDSFLHELVVRHEAQHGETMLQAIELARLTPPPARARSARATAASPTTTSARATAPRFPASGSAARRSRTPRS